MCFYESAFAVCVPNTLKKKQVVGFNKECCFYFGIVRVFFDSGADVIHIKFRDRNTTDNMVPCLLTAKAVTGSVTMIFVTDHNLIRWAGYM